MAMLEGLCWLSECQYCIDQARKSVLACRIQKANLSNNNNNKSAFFLHLAYEAEQEEICRIGCAWRQNLAIRASQDLMCYTKKGPAGDSNVS